jgi:SagB-type dehydrogenase family enzyme
MTPDAPFRLTELDRTGWPEIRDQVMQFTHVEPLGQPRSYPGYPRWPLARCRPGLWPPLERVLWSRRCERVLSEQLPSRRELGRLLLFSHGISASHGRGPTPSSGGLQALELYVVALTAGWLPEGAYHYDRTEHTLEGLAQGGDRAAWLARVPALGLIEGGALLWVLVGDGARITSKYGARGWRFLLLEAGHLMQNLCLMSRRLGLATVPLGACFEQEVARALALPAEDAVLYLGVCGEPT